MKTIFGPKKLLDDWVTALKSGKYTQGNGHLYFEGEYCCLGVLQCVVDGKTEDRGSNDIELPSMHWLKDHKIEFRNVRNKDDQTPYLPNLKCSADYANDQEVSFRKIAEAIEDCMEYTDAKSE